MTSQRVIKHSLVLRLLLRPIARFCLRRSIKLQDAIEQLKSSMLEVALSEMRQKKQKPTASRLAIMTGVHRKDVSRIIERGEIKNDDFGLPTRVIGQWRTHTDFKNVSGQPRALSVEGNDSEFARLVRSVSKELNPYTLLFELERIGAVKRHGNKLKLETQVYVPKGNNQRALEMLASDSEDLIEAVEENISSDLNFPNLHLTTTYDNICLKAVDQIRDWILTEGSKFHERVREYLSRFDIDSNPKLKGEPAGSKVTVGAFSRIAIPLISSGEKL